MTAREMPQQFNACFARVLKMDGVGDHLKQLINFYLDGIITVETMVKHLYRSEK